MTLDRTLAWRDALRAAAPPPTDLSGPGLARVLADALDALGELPAAAALIGEAPARATVIAPRTVVTAPIEWCALLLAAGAEVTLKPPRGAPGLGPWLVHHAQATGLPLRLDPSRDAVAGADLVVAMGSDDTMTNLRAAISPNTRLLAFGHRIGVAWWPRGADPAGLAADLAAHDSRGCMTPAVILTDDPDLAALTDALTAAEAAWPRGVCSPGELAAIRTRGLLARVVGEERRGPGWALHVVPPAHVQPWALPRVAQVVPVADEAAARAWVRAHAEVGTVGAPGGGDWGVPRTADLGQMQRPPLRRAHDGVDALAALRR
jgi:hypothetical protein